MYGRDSSYVRVMYEGLHNAHAGVERWRAPSPPLDG